MIPYYPLEIFEHRGGEMDDREDCLCWIWRTRSDVYGTAAHLCRMIEGNMLHGYVIWSEMREELQTVM